MLKGKKCSKCGLVKPRDEFHKSSKLKSGLMSWCKQCRHEKYLENHDQNLSRARKNRRTREERIEYYRKNPNKFKKYHKTYREKLRLEVLIHYGGNPPKCACCGEPHLEFLSIDYIHGDGRKHRRKIGNSSISLYRWLIKNNFPEGFQVLCMNCNCAKAWYGICPHKTKIEKMEKKA